MYLGLYIVSVYLLLLPYFTVNKDFQHTSPTEPLAAMGAYF